MKRIINEWSGFGMIIGVVMALVGVVLWVDSVIDTSLMSYGILILIGSVVSFQATLDHHRPSALNHGKVVGVILDIDGDPELVFENGYTMSNRVAHIFLGEYFLYGDWPHDPMSGQRLKMVSLKEIRDKDSSHRRVF